MIASDLVDYPCEPNGITLWEIRTLVISLEKENVAFLRK